MEGFTTEEKIALFREMISCCHMMLLAEYDALLHRIGSCTEEEATANELFSLSWANLPLENFLAADRTPVLFTNRVNMMWLCCPEFAGEEPLRVYVLGPFFLDDYSSFAIDSGLAGAGASAALRQNAAKLVRKLPILSWARVQEYALMLHYLITGEKIRQSALRSFGSGDLLAGGGEGKLLPDTHGTYQAEQEMLRMVREGDLELVRHIDRMAVTGTMGQLAQAGDALRQMKNSVLVCTTLFSRTAIEGGLSPETAYTLCDRYFQSVERVKSLSELTSIAYTMQRDFVERVHAVRTQKLSREIEAACSYIERHLEEDLSIASLAAYAGYIEYYFSKKFKRELGLTPAEYIRKKRLAKAALLLRSTDLDAQQIASRLQFCSQSYFTDCFRKEYGVSPTKYRKEGKA